MNTLIRYQQLNNGIHEITFLAKSRASVDEFYQTMQILYEATSPKEQVRLLVDLSMPGLIPLQYMFQESQNWRRRNPNNLPIRAVILYPEKGVLPIARVLINSVLQTRGKQVKLHLESLANRDAAIEWLLQDVL